MVQAIMDFDLLIKNGTLVTPAKTAAADIGIINGKIAFVGIAGGSQKAAAVYDAKGKHIFSGMIDAHVHFREPGLAHKEDFQTGSAAAACGGITLAMDMPNTVPVTSTIERFTQKRALAEEKSYIDFALFALLSENNIDEIEKLANAGAAGFKVFLGTSTGDIAAPSAGILYEQMRRIAGLGMRIGFHCENNALNAHFTALCKKGQDSENPALLSAARPDISEADAIAQAIRFAVYTGAKIHIHHVSSRQGVELVRDAKQRRLPVTAETCPHYLLFDENDYQRLGKALKVYPPIRREADRDALWEALRDGTIDLVASDHAPHAPDEKALPLWEAASGFTGVETLAPLLLNAVNSGRLSLNDAARLTSEGPARIWGIYPQKGGCAPGCDADFTIVDMEQKRTIRGSKLHSKHRHTVYEGMEISGAPVATIVRGALVMKDGEICVKPGFGKAVL